MTVWLLVGIAVATVALLLVLISVLRLPAFLALLLTAIALALATGTPPGEVIGLVQAGMAGTLGYIAVVIGLGAMIGAMLERSGGAAAIADAFVRRLGPERAPWGLLATGLLVATPVFFDVALVLLIPFAYAAARRTGRPMLIYAIPLLAGIAVAHSFIPPTPGPVAVAGLVGADLGRVVVVGILAGVPAAVVGGIVFGRRVAGRVEPDLSVIPSAGDAPADGRVGAGAALSVVLLPLVLILAGTAWAAGSGGASWVSLATHPFTALAAGLLGAIWVLGHRAGIPGREVARICNRGLEPVGLIILVTGAGGVLGKVLVAAGAGEVIAGAASGSGMPVLLLAFGTAVLVRVVQGSATVSMVTAAGLVAPLLAGASGWLPALTTIAIASGATVLSHVNDSGFWLVGRYVGLSESDTFRVWTVLETILGGVGFAVVLLLSLILS
jgi:gluconate transporter